MRANLEEVVSYYATVFKNMRVFHKNPTLASFEIEGQRLMALSGAPHSKLTEAISLSIRS